MQKARSEWDSRDLAWVVRGSLERMTGIEPALRPWEGRVLPLNYIRMSQGLRNLCA